MVLNNKIKYVLYCKPVVWRWRKLLMPAKALEVSARGKSG